MSELPDRKELEQALQQQFDKKVQIKHSVRETRAEWLETGTDECAACDQRTIGQSL